MAYIYIIYILYYNSSSIRLNITEYILKFSQAILQQDFYIIRGVHYKKLYNMCRRVKERVYYCREYNVHNIHTNNIVEQYNKTRAIYYLLTRILFLIWLVGSRTTVLHRRIPVLHGGVCGEPVFFFVMLFRKNGVSNLLGKGLHELIHLLFDGFPEFPNQVLLMSQALECNIFLLIWRSV